MAHHCRPLIPGERARSRSSADYDLPSHCTYGTTRVYSGTYGTSTGTVLVGKLVVPTVLVPATAVPTTAIVL